MATTAISLNTIFALWRVGLIWEPVANGRNIEVMLKLAHALGYAGI